MSDIRCTLPDPAIDNDMQRQAVIKPEIPMVGTGLEGRVAADSGQTIQSRTSGFGSETS